MYRLVTATITLARQASRPSHWARSLRCTRPLPFRLARISPDSAGFEARSFECPKCDHVVIERVATDPLEHAKTGHRANSSVRSKADRGFAKVGHRTDFLRRAQLVCL